MARKMKDSGIEWIGEIPEGWEIIPVKYLAKYNYATLAESCSPDFEFSYIDIGSVTYTDGITNYQNFKFKDAPSRARRIVHSGDILVSTVRTYLRAVACVNEHRLPQIASTGFLVLQADTSKIHPHFLMYSVLSDNFICKVEANSVGISYPAINASQIVHFKLPIPQLSEQFLLVTYLDRQCSEIDALLSKNLSSIEDYKKLKQAVITQAVTKGVRGEREKKDSGVGWIGAIPKDWEIKRLKSFCTIVDCKNRTPDVFPDGKYTVVRTTCIKDCSFSYEGSYQTDTTNFKAWTLKGQPHKGDIFFTREAPVGEACLVPNADNLCMGQRVMFFRPEDNSDARYIMYSIYGPLVREYIASKNSGSTVGHLKLGQVACIPIFYCPPLEQKEIADYLDAKCAEIAGLIAKKEQLVKELENYKKSLIYEVVTGKREV